MKTTLYPFEKLRVGQSAREFTKEIYLITSSFPKSEIYGLTSQCNRAAVSIAANLAEGTARQSRKDQAHFSRSLMAHLWKWLAY